MKVFITPNFRGEDLGDGGIRRCVDAQKKYFPEYGIEVVKTEPEADLVAIHAGAWVETSKPVLAHCHGLYWDEYEWPLWAKRLNVDVVGVLHKAQAITAPSEWVANAVRRGMWADCTVLYHGISTDEWKPLAKAQRDSFILWNKTRVDPICDPTPVAKLAEMMPGQRFVSTYLLGGSGAVAGEPSNVTVTGVLPYESGKQLVHRAGVYLCTTRETFGIGTVEALAAGVPVVGWDWGGQHEIVRHKETGWLCKPGDMDGLAEGIEYCLKHGAELGKAARQDVLKRFTWGQAIKRYVPLYESVLEAWNKPRPKVSVIIPCHKLEHFLQQCLDSVLQQSMPDHQVEVIVVDDFSPTWDVTIEQNYLARGVRFIHNVKNLYLAGALNAGIAASSGDYILCLDADNFISAGTLAVLAGELDKHRALDIAYGRVKFVNPDGSADTGVSGDGISTWPFDNFSFMRQLQQQNQIPSTCMYRRWVWERSGGYRRRYKTAEDADFWARAVSIGAIPAKVTDAVTLIYRQRADSMSRVNEQANWNAWYPWATKYELTPFVAARDDVEYPNVQSYDPSIVTVIIPVGPGHQDIVVDAVDSVIAQTYQKYDVLVVNDSGSRLPSLPAFVRTYSTSGEGSTGPAYARNVGIAAVKTPYFLLLDADDILHPDALELMMPLAAPDMLVYSDWVVHETGEVHECSEWSAENLMQTMFMSVSCVYPTRLVREIGGFDVDLKAWEDYDLIINLCAHGVCGVRVPVPLLQYRVQSGTVREKIYADKPAALAAMRAKWKESDFMACGACAQRASDQQRAIYERQQNPFNSSVMTNSQVVNQGDTSDLVQVEFILPEHSTRVYAGQSTGQQYRFSADEPIQYIYKADLDDLLALTKVFRLFVGSTEPVGTPEPVGAGVE